MTGLRNLAVFLGMGLVVVAPLLWFFWQHPEAFWVRIGQVGGDTSSDYWSGFLEAVGMLGWKGDPYWRFNLPFRPALSPVLVILSVVGLWMMRRVWRVLLLIVVTIVVMLLPTALAVGEILPSNLRAIGIFPFVLLPGAYVLEGIVPLQSRGGSRRFVGRSVAAVIVVITSLLAGQTYRHYFVEWANREDVYFETDADLGAVAGYLDEVGDKAAAIFVASKHYQHPTVAFQSDYYDRIEWLVNAEAFVLPADYPALYVFPQSAVVPAWMREVLPDATEQNDAFEAFWLDSPIEIALENRVDFDFGSVIELVGYEVEQDGAMLDVRLEWVVNGVTARPLTPFVHVESAGGHRWSQGDSIGYLAEQWEAGERFVTNVHIPVPEGMPPGNYRLLVGLFDGAERLNLVDEGGRFAGSTAILDVGLAGNDHYSGQMPEFVIDEKVASGMTVLGYELGVESAESGSHVPLSIWWLLDEPLLNDVSLELVPPNGARTVWVDDLGLQGQSGFVISRVEEVLPVAMGSADYSIELAADGQTVDLAQLSIAKTERLYEQPAVTIVDDALFGDQIRLVGHTLTEQNGVFELEVVWQAVGEVAADYTIFLHALNPDNSCCAWQQDAMPQQNTYPTSRWVSGEFVVDKWMISWDNPVMAMYPVEVGLYDASTGRRLILRSELGDSTDFKYLSPIIVR